MYLMIMIFIIINILMTLLIILNLIFYKKLFSIRKKNSSIECGFNMLNKFNLPFSIQFYYISILFLIFDIEIALILPLIQKLMFSFINFWMTTFIMIILILLIGLYIEWWNNLIKWMNFNWNQKEVNYC